MRQLSAEEQRAAEEWALTIAERSRSVGGTNTLDKCARALAHSQCGEDCFDALEPEAQEGLRENVRAVLQAIREPSEAMIAAFVDKALHDDVLSHGGWPGYARDQWKAMVDAALAEGEG